MRHRHRVGVLLDEGHELLERLRLEDVAHIMSLEEGKLLRESRGETLKGVSLLEYYAGEGFRLSGKTLRHLVRSGASATVAAIGFSTIVCTPASHSARATSSCR